MTLENIILTGFVCAAIACGYLLFLFFKPRGDRTPPPLTWRRWTAGNALIILFLAALVLAAGEVYYRFFQDDTDAYMLTKISRRWLRRHYQINRSEVRDSTEYVWKIQPGKRRITFLGDSFTVGHGVKDVENRFANLLRHRQPGWEVHVLAQNGWETGDELTLMESELRADYELDTVVLVYVLNDISDLSIEYYRNAVRRVTQRWQMGPCLDKSYFLNTWYYRLRMAADPDLGDYFRYVEDWYHGPLWTIQEERLRKLHEVVTRRGGRLLVVTFPFLQSTGDAYPFRRIHAQMGELWSLLGVPHLDLADTLLRHPSRQVVVNRFDAHPNEYAHALAADAIEEFIQSNMANPLPEPLSEAMAAPPRNPADPFSAPSTAPR